MGALYHPFEVYHDVVVAFIQILIIAPLTAAFVEIYHRKEKIELRNRIIVQLNVFVVNIYVELTQAFVSLGFIDIDAITAELREFIQNNLREAIDGSPGVAAVAEQIEEHNRRVEVVARSREGYLLQSSFKFGKTKSVCEQMQMYVGVFASSFDTDEFESIEILSGQVAQIAGAASELEFFIGMVMKRYESIPTPPILNYNQFLDEWDSYLEKIGNIRQKNWRMKLTAAIARVFGHGDIFGSFDENKRDEMRRIIRMLKTAGTAQLGVERQSIIIKQLLGTDLARLERTRIEEPKK